MRLRIHLKKKRHKLSVGNTIIIIFILVVTMTYFSLNYLNKNVVPVLMSYATSQVRKFSSLIINRAISKQIAEDLTPCHNAHRHRCLPPAAGKTCLHQTCRADCTHGCVRSTHYLHPGKGLHRDRPIPSDGIPDSSDT